MMFLFLLWDCAATCATIDYRKEKKRTNELNGGGNVINNKLNRKKIKRTQRQKF